MGLTPSTGRGWMPIHQLTRRREDQSTIRPRQASPSRPSPRSALAVAQIARTRHPSAAVALDVGMGRASAEESSVRRGKWSVGALERQCQTFSAPAWQ